jgi:hypothetical protein
MSFNPKFDRSGDEPDFDGELPADFAALGEQLQVDANRLSSVYPACKPPTKLIEALDAQSQEQWSRHRLFAVVSSAAAVLLVVGLIALAFSPAVLRIARDEPAAVPNAPSNAVVIAPPALMPEKTLPDMPADLQPVSFRPAVMNINGPELEGLLDLWQEQPPAAGSISF